MAGRLLRKDMRQLPSAGAGGSRTTATFYNRQGRKSGSGRISLRLLWIECHRLLCHRDQSSRIRWALLQILSRSDCLLQELLRHELEQLCGVGGAQLTHHG